MVSYNETKEQSYPPDLLRILFCRLEVLLLTLAVSSAVGTPLVEPPVLVEVLAGKLPDGPTSFFVASLLVLSEFFLQRK